MSKSYNPYTGITIVNHISNGLRAKEIGVKMGLSSRTIEHHVSRLLLIHNAKSQAHLVAIFLRSELIK